MKDMKSRNRYIDNGIMNFGAIIISEILKVNKTLTSIDLNGKWINKRSRI